MKPLQQLKFLPFYKTNFGPHEITSITNVLQSGWIQTGPVAEEFTQKLRTFCQATHLQLTSSATSGLFLTLQALKIGQGDQVITSPYTFVATANAIMQTGATVVFADPLNHYLLSGPEIASKITPQTKAIICVDFAGVPCDYTAIYEAVYNNPCKNKPVIIADASHALGSSQRGVPCGSLADFTIFSFHAVKNVTTGDGGAIVANQHRSPLNLDWNEIFTRLRRTSLHGMTRCAYERSEGSAWEYDVLEMGYKFNMTDLEACLGISQLSSLLSRKERRQEILNWYQTELKLHPEICLWEAQFGAEIFPHILPIQVPFWNEKTRNQALIEMHQSGIGCNVHYKPVPLMTYYENLGYQKADIPRAKNLYDKEITLPLYESLSQADVNRIVTTLSKIVAKQK